MTSQHVQWFFAKKNLTCLYFLASIANCILFFKNGKAFEHLESLVSGVGTSICLHILSLRHDRGCPADYTWWSSSLSSSLSSPLSASLSCSFCHENDLRTSPRKVLRVEICHPPESSHFLGLCMILFMKSCLFAFEGFPELIGMKKCRK